MAASPAHHLFCPTVHPSGRTTLKSEAGPTPRFVWHVLRNNLVLCFLRGGSSNIFQFHDTDPLYCTHTLEGADHIPQDAHYILTLKGVDFLPRDIRLTPAFRVMIPSLSVVALEVLIPLQGASWPQGSNFLMKAPLSSSFWFPSLRPLLPSRSWFAPFSRCWRCSASLSIRVHCSGNPTFIAPLRKLDLVDPSL